MREVPNTITQRFTSSFCYGRKGYSLKELDGLFRHYQVEAPSIVPSMPPTKGDFFASCLYALAPENQRQFLYDLCDNPPSAAGPLPSVDERRELLHSLVQADGVSPLAVEISSLTLRGVREKWFEAASRLCNSPASAITSARALLETTCKTILVERHEAPDTSGDLSRLYRQTRRVLKVEAKAGTSQSIHMMLNGLTQVVNGIAPLSNLGGDRHGLACGARLTDPQIAGLAIHAAGTVSLFLVRIHRFTMRTNSNNLLQGTSKGHAPSGP